MALASTEHVLVSRDDRVLTLTLNRPDRLNAIDPDVSGQIRHLFSQVDSDADTDVVVLTGAGRGFCAGGDVKSMSARNQPSKIPEHVHSRGRHLINTILSMEKPLIAMVNGPAIGLGATIALSCDMVIMADDATIGDRHVNVGLVAGDGGAVMWPLLLGPLRAKEFLMTGRSINGREAADIGLVNRSVPLSDLHTETMTLARDLAALPPFAVRGTKASINRYVQWMTNLVLDTSLAWEKISAMSLDHQEALQARVERRPGVYRGR